MALPRKYQTENDIPEELRPYYTQAADGTWQLDAEGDAPSSDDVQRMRRALDHEREQRRKATEQLHELSERYKDVDPEKAREALAQLDTLEEQRLRSAKDFEALAARQYGPKIRQLEQQITQMQQAIEAGNQRVQQERRKFESVAIDQQLESTMLRLGGDPKRVPLALPTLRQPWRMDETDRAVAMEGENIVYGTDPSRPITIEEYCQNALKLYPWLALESNGSNATQRQGGGTLTGNQLLINPEEARGPNWMRRYEALQAQAAKTGAEITFGTP